MPGISGGNKTLLRLSEITLDKDKNENGITYSKVKLSLKGRLDPDTVKKLKAFQDSLKPALDAIKVKATSRKKKCSRNRVRRAVPENSPSPENQSFQKGGWYCDMDRTTKKGKVTYGYKRQWIMRTCPNKQCKVVTTIANKKAASTQLIQEKYTTKRGHKNGEIFFRLYLNTTRTTTY